MLAMALLRRVFCATGFRQIHPDIVNAVRGTLFRRMMHHCLQKFWFATPEPLRGLAGEDNVRQAEMSIGSAIKGFSH
jgi:hypothetical protein